LSPGSLIKRTLYTIGITFILIFALGAALYVYSSVISSIGPRVLCDAQSSGSAWVDLNGNGILEEDDPPLGGVCIWSDLSVNSFEAMISRGICESPRHLTGEEGDWAGEFYAGSCGDDLYVFALAPEGYQATTPQVIHSGNASFGFAPPGLLPQTDLPTIDEQVSGFIHAEEEAMLREATFFRILAGAVLLLIILLAWFIAGRVEVWEGVSNRARQYIDQGDQDAA